MIVAVSRSGWRAAERLIRTSYFMTYCGTEEYDSEEAILIDDQ